MNLFLQSRRCFVIAIVRYEQQIDEKLISGTFAHFSEIDARAVTTLESPD
jgi:hypothetical protein